MNALFWVMIFDYFVRLLPGGVIIVAAVVAKKQLAAGRRATAVTIAKNHYRELLEACSKNSDIIFLGSTIEGYAELRRQPLNYRRYRWLAAQMLFALQEVYIALPNDKHWERTIVIVALAFKHYLISETEIPPLRTGRLARRFHGPSYEGRAGTRASNCGDLKFRGGGRD